MNPLIHEANIGKLKKAIFALRVYSDDDFDYIGWLAVHIASRAGLFCADGDSCPVVPARPRTPL